MNVLPCDAPGRVTVAPPRTCGRRSQAPSSSGWRGAGRAPAALASERVDAGPVLGAQKATLSSVWSMLLSASTWGPRGQILLAETMVGLFPRLVLGAWLLLLWTAAQGLGEDQGTLDVGSGWPWVRGQPRLPTPNSSGCSAAHTAKFSTGGMTFPFSA